MIYDWIIDNFSYFKKADPSWQITFKNSIRHNLSLNKCFRKIARQKDEPGKGGFWTLEPDFERQEGESLDISVKKQACNTPDKVIGLNVTKRKRNGCKASKSKSENEEEILTVCEELKVNFLLNLK